ncbi:hypothetical protein [Ruegeria lacuscaerulensis]|uniref:hypothetical protein n=1 Tax=Ruegeria lacuscaerulensis TaxID=55218 RepID=UPI00147FE589|nr:hypothetical protein [Ruegeria lacuscaerulensis]
MDKMATVSIREAVKHYKVSRPTLTKALKSGKISGVQDGKGQWQIDSAELARVYQVRESHPVNGGQNEPVKLSTVNTPDCDNIEGLKVALALAEARADAAETLAQERAERIEDLRRILPAPEEIQQHRKKWWPWSR